MIASNGSTEGHGPGEATVAAAAAAAVAGGIVAETAPFDGGTVLLPSVSKGKTSLRGVE